MTRILSLVNRHIYLTILTHVRCRLRLASHSLCRIDERHTRWQNHLRLWWCGCHWLLGLLSSSRSSRLIRLNLMLLLFSCFRFYMRRMAGIGHHARVCRLHRGTSTHALKNNVLRCSRGRIWNNACACQGILCTTSLSLWCLSGCGCRSAYHLRLLTCSLRHDDICTSIGRLSTL